MWDRALVRKALIGVVVIVVGALLIVWRCHGGDSTGGASGSGSGGAGDWVGGSSVARGGKRLPSVPASLAGRVTRKADGGGIANAVVSIARGELGAEVIPTETPTIVVVTGADGGWRAPVVPPGTYVVAATAVGFLPASHDKLALASGEARGGVDLVLDAGGTVVRGTVSDVGGGPIGGARVTARRDTFSLAANAELVALTATDGSYQLSLPDGRFAATATHDDYTSAHRTLEVAGKPLTADFKLVPGGVVRGEVVARDTGKPVPGAIVRASTRRRPNTGGEHQALADDDGKFTLRHVDSGLVSLTASGRGYASASPTAVQVSIGEQVEDVRVVVDRAYSISGTIVKTGTDTGIPGVRIAAFSLGSQQEAIAPDPSDADGRFEIVGVRPANYLLFAIGDALVPDLGKSVDVKDKDVDGVRIEMSAGVTLAGRVDPPGPARVSLGLAGQIGIGNMFQMVAVGLVRGEADATGAFELHAVPTGKLVVIATTDDGHTGKLDVTVADADQRDLVVKLEARANLVGKVIDTNNAPVANVQVRATPMERPSAIDMADDRDGTTTAADGTFRIVGLDPGKVMVWVSDREGPLATKDKTQPTFDVAVGTDTQATITVEARDGTIRGHVTTKDGAPAPDVWVSAHRTAGSHSTTTVIGAEAMMDGLGPAPQLTGADGAFAFEHLRHGSYELVADGASSRASKSGVAIGDTVSLVLAPLGTLSGKVMRGAAPVQLYDLSCKGPDGEVDRRVTSSDGAYELEHLAPGPYACSVTSDTGVASGSADVPQGDAHLDLTLADWATVSATVVSVLTGKPIAGIAAVAQSAGGRDGQSFVEALTGHISTRDDAGHVTVERVAAGSGKLVLYPKDSAFQQLASTPYTAAAGQNVDLGAIKVVPPRTGDAGTLGMVLTADGTSLVVADVKVGGPAEAAGVKPADKITSIDGVPVAGIGAAIGQELLASGTVAAGQTVALGLDRGGTAVQVTVVAAKW